MKYRRKERTENDRLRPLVRQGGREGLSEGQHRNTDPKEVRESHVGIEGAEWARPRGRPV